MMALRTAQEDTSKDSRQNISAWSIVLDFDAAKSVKTAGNDRYLLKPTIRIKEIIYDVNENQPSDPVTGPIQTPTYVVSSQLRYYQLSLLDVDGDGQDDPDGDQVFFRSSALPSYMSLDEVTIDTPVMPDMVIVNFWSEDEHGADTSGTPFTVTFNFIMS